MIKKVFLCILILFVIILPVVSQKVFAVPEEKTAENGDVYQEVEFYYGTGKSDVSDRTGMVFNFKYFMGNNEEYNPEIAKCAVGMATAVYQWDYISAVLGEYNLQFEFDEYKETAENRKGNWDREHTNEDNDFVRYVIATKTFRYQGEDYIFYCVPVQGTTSSYDWDSDFNIGDTNDHEGFYAAHDEIMVDLYEHLTSTSAAYDKDHTIILTTGHSRGASVSNIVAGELTLGYSPRTGINFSNLVSPSNVYGYHFACPAISSGSYVSDSKLKNIFSLNNADDLIPRLPLEDWGYKRYGITLTLPSLDRINVNNRYRQIFSRDYLGTPDTVVYLEDALNNMVTNSSEARTPTMKVVFKGVSYIIRGGRDPIEFLKEAGIEIKESLIDKIKDKLALFLDPFSLIDTLIRKIEVLSSDLPRYINETMLMDEQQFSAWCDEHRSEIDEMEELYGININVPSDLTAVYVIVLSDLEFKFLGKDIDAGTLESYLHAACDVFVYMTTTENGLKTLDKIFDGHMPSTYVVWTNSMNYGYKGWYGCPQGTAPDVGLYEDSGIRTIGAYCFSGAQNLQNFVSDENLEYVGTNAFMDAVYLDRMVLPSTMRYIGDRAFSGCVNMTAESGSLVLAEGLEYLGRNAFKDCKGITSLEIPVGRVADGYYSQYSSGQTDHYTPFGGCTNISYIKVTGSGEMPEMAYTTSTTSNTLINFNGTATPWGAASKG
ncbi:MAG: leucine-rich repeat protein, partial [Erysipelotrichales bacterium]|nr:leucine-rich repeat protein [Erysipelotrichales bacterium]